MADNEKRPNGRKFRFLREIASGGFGMVYLTKVTHADGFSRILAVKLLHRRWSDNAEISRRMRDEARLLGWLRHRNIVDVADLTSIDGRTAILMEYLEAADLKEIVQHHRNTGSTVPVRCALEVMSAAASALDAAYNRPPYQGEKPLRVIHRDIKPSNIMVDDSGLVKVLDFGVARAEFEARESDTRELQFGSVDYMPPERLMFEPESPASDIYSLGATAFEIMSGEKLGKAKGSPARHDGNIIDRLSFLRAIVALPSGVADELDELLSATLGFDETARPDAAQVWAITKSLARKIGGPSLAEW
jgi:serine/threonine protein kinase